MFRALVLDKEPTFNATVQSLEENRLPDADVHVQVAYSTLNYKDGLAITNKSPVVRVWPMVAGIDGAGSVISSTHADWKAGDHFVHNGWGVGETHWGCLSEQARLKGDWLVKLPKAFTPRQAMAIGTAGYTAMLCVMALEQQGVQAGKGEVLVTGATGGGRQCGCGFACQARLPSGSRHRQSQRRSVFEKLGRAKHHGPR